MAVHLRLSRYGRTHLPYFRVVATDQREHREGKYIELLGSYDPRAKDKNLKVDIDKVHAWLRKGAQYSDGLAPLMKHFGYEVFPADLVASAAKKKAKAKAGRKSRKKQDPKVFVPASRRAKRGHAAKLKAERMAKAAAEKAAADAAKAAAAPAEGAAPAQA